LVARLVVKNQMLGFHRGSFLVQSLARFFAEKTMLNKPPSCSLALTQSNG
jgi:hypothetical protein